MNTKSSPSRHRHFIRLVLPALALLASDTAWGYWVAREEGQYWTSIAASADGTHLVAAKIDLLAFNMFQGVKLYTSTDGGEGWTERFTIAEPWTIPYVASSSTGAELVAVVKGDRIYTSTDYGVTWFARESVRSWSCVASSDDGNKLVAGVESGYLYTSTDGGIYWTERVSSGSRHWRDLASSSDGTKLLAVAENSNVYTSTDSGLTWTMRYAGDPGTPGFRSAASSGDGTLLLVGEGTGVTGGDLFRSYDSGIYWNEQGFPGAWASVAISRDGSRNLAATYGGPIYDLANNGRITPTEAKYWQDITVSTDGGRVFGAEARYNAGEFLGNGRLWAYFDDGTPGITVTATDEEAGEPGSGRGSGTFTFRRTGLPLSVLTVNFTVGGTATSGVDYAALGTAVTFREGNAIATKIVNVIDDTDVEGCADETVILTLAGGTGYRVAFPSSATVKIQDDETPHITVVATDPTAGEPGTGQGSGTFTFTRTGLPTSVLTVNFTVGGTATSGSDYAPLGTTMTFPAGSATATKTVNVISDTYVEGDETVVLTLTSGTGYCVDPPSMETVTATVTIKDDEPPGAQYKHWQGDVSRYWDDPGNWLENAVPVNGDHLFFEEGATHKAPINNMSGLQLDGITFTDVGGYNVSGNGVTLSGGIANASPGVYNELEIDLTLGASQTFGCQGGPLTLSGNIELGAHTLTADTEAGTSLSISGGPGEGVISGSGGVTKEGAGTLKYWGSSANTYSGPTHVRDGILILSRQEAPSIAGPGPLTIGDAVGGTGTAVVRYNLYDNQIGSVPIVVEGDGLLDLAGRSDTIGTSLTMNGKAQVWTSSGLLTLDANTTVTCNPLAPCTISGNLNIGSSGTCTFDIITGYFYLDASVSGAADIVKNGAGRLFFNAANTFTGSLTANDGILALTDSQALGANGSSASGTVVNNPAMLQIWTEINVGNEYLTLNVTSPNVAFYNSSQNNSWAGPITLNQDAVIKVWSGSELDLTGEINGPGGITKSYPGLLRLSGTAANTYGGTTTVNAGKLSLGEANPNNDESSVSIAASGATLELNFAGSDTVRTFFIGGTEQVAGTYGHTDSGADNGGAGVGALNTIFEPGTGSLTVTGPGYAGWAATNAGGQGPELDFDGDGVENGVEYVVGGLSSTNDLDKLPGVATPGGDMTFTFIRDQASVDGSTTVKIEVGTDLSSWPTVYTVGADTGTSTPGVTVIDNLDGTDTVILTVTRDTDAKFARLNVSVP